MAKDRLHLTGIEAHYLLFALDYYLHTNTDGDVTVAFNDYSMKNWQKLRNKLLLAHSHPEEDPCGPHEKGDGSWWAYDGYGIELCRVCEKCEEAKLSRYRSDIMERYDCDEPIDED